MSVKAQKKVKVKNMPQFKVLLHNDDIHSVADAVKAIQRIMHFDVEQSTELAQEAQSKEVCLLCVTHKEKAELIQDQFQTLTFKVTIEAED